MDTLLRDVVSAARRLAAQRGFTLAALLTLALGIGANTAMFSIVHGLLLRPLPYPDPGRIVRVGESRSVGGGMLTNRAMFLFQNAEAFEQLAAYRESSLAGAGPDGSVTLRGATVSPALFPLLRATPHLGRLFAEDEALGVVRTGPLNVATSAQSSMPPELLDLVSGELPPGVRVRVVSRTRSVTRDGASAPLRDVGEEVRGPLTLHHSRAELPTGVTVDLWTYRFPNANPVVGLGLTLAESWRSTAPDGTPELQETRIVNVSEVEFDLDAFSLDPSLGFRVEDMWDVLAR